MGNEVGVEWRRGGTERGWHSDWPRVPISYPWGPKSSPEKHLKVFTRNPGGHLHTVCRSFHVVPTCKTGVY